MADTSECAALEGILDADEPLIFEVIWDTGDCGVVDLAWSLSTSGSSGMIMVLLGEMTHKMRKNRSMPSVL
jgi:hypothetical protein